MKVSIVTPSFNQGEYLERTLLSVLNQKGGDFEYIVLDGNSSDNSKQILEKHRERIDHLVIEQDDGQADAVQKGFALASGDILCYLNSDDILLPDAIRYVTNFFETNPNIDALYTNRLFVDEYDRVKKFWILPPHCPYCMSRWDFIPQESCFWRRSLMEKSGPINTDFKFALDYDLFVRMMQSGRFIRVNRFLAAFRIHPTSKSTTLYETLGRKEVSIVRSANGIRIHWYDHLLKYLFGGSILGISFVFKVLAINVVRKRIRFPWED